MLRHPSFIFLLLIPLCLGQCAKGGGEMPPAKSKLSKLSAEQLFDRAKKLYTEGLYEEALPYLDQFRQAYPKDERYREVFLLFQEVQGRLSKGKYKVGVLLPLAGEYAKYGEIALEGILCALGVFAPFPEADPKAQLVIRDSGGDASQAATQMTALVAEDKVSSVIGPLLSVEVDSVTRLANEQSVPLVVLAPKEPQGSSPRGSSEGFVFYHSLTPRREVSQLVRVAVDKMGLKRFFVFYPKNRYGVEYKDLFENEVKGRGGLIVDSKSYPPGEIDFTSAVRSYKLSKDTDTPPFEAVFLPDSYKKVGPVAYAFEFLEWHGLKFLGTSRWHHPALAEEFPSSLSGAVFVSGFFPITDKAKTFQEYFLQSFGREPSWIEAIGYDAAALLLESYRNAGTDYPPDLQKSLRAIRDFPGAMGKISWDENGNSQWSPVLLTVGAGGIQPLQP